MGQIFSYKTTQGYGRRGKLITRRGNVATPLFMPVATRGVVKGLLPAEVRQTGARLQLSNTYHLHLQPGEQLIKKFGGLHAYAGWNGPILTDSGGFQVFSLAHVRKITEDGVTFKDPASGREVMITPETSMQIQYSLGSDIIMAFDDLTGLDKTGRARTLEAFDRTHRWLDRSISEFKRLTANNKASPLLFGIVQGGLDLRLRRKSLEFVQSRDVSGIAIGGLAVGEERIEMYKVLKYLAPLYEPARPRYLMGVGEPKDMRFAIEHGIDMFDCVLPTRNGRHGSVWVSGDKRLNLNNAVYTTDKKPIDPKCGCDTCQAGYSRSLLRHLFKVNDPLAGRLASIHNLYYLQRLCEGYR